MVDYNGEQQPKCHDTWGSIKGTTLCRGSEHSSAVNRDALKEWTQMKFWAGLWQNMVTR